MKKIAFVSSPKREHSRSPFIVCRRMVEMFPSSVFVTDDEADYENLRKNGYTIFCYGHTPRMYERRKITRDCLRDVVNTREEWLKTAIGIKCQSGFSYIKRRIDLYDCFFPTITTYKRPQTPTIPCVGYYARSVRHDTDKEFMDLASRIPLEIPIVIMGNPLQIRRPYYFTQSEDEFFSMCTHYFYMKSSITEDPFPHTLLQACQCGCSLVMPFNERPWKDGIDDILDVCEASPIDSKKVKYPWEIEKPCTFAPKGEDFMKLYDEITSSWNFLPYDFKTFSSLYEYALKI